MKERPIPFSAPMVRAVLAGAKAQTRRLVKPSPMPDGGWTVAARPCGFELVHWDNDEQERRAIACPYGHPGDQLWVREAFRFTDVFDADSPSRVGERCVDAGYRTPWAPIQFEADRARLDWRHTGTPPNDGPPRPGKLRPAMFMPRWASRLTLEVLGVRVERLQDISEADALAEGVVRFKGAAGIPGMRPLPDHYAAAPSNVGISAVEAYASLWRDINGPGSWDSNPWVWCVEFRRIHG